MHAEQVYETDERFAAEYTLPDPLLKEDGSRVANAAEWMQFQRGKILDLFKKYEYGEILPRPDKMEFQLLSRKDDALNGTAVRKEVRILCSMKNGKSHSFDMLLYVPKKRTGPVPAFLGLNFKGNQNTTAETDVLPTGRKSGNTLVCEDRAAQCSRWQFEKVIERGYASATICYHDIHPDYTFSTEHSVFHLFFEPGEYEKIPEKYSIIGAWAWGLSRAMDYLESDPDIDPTRVAVHGHSRLGKTSLWAGAVDTRFRMVISNCSGCGGASLHKRKIGENLSQHRFFTEKKDSTPCWFVNAAADFVWKEENMPFDQHELLALTAPRPLALATATEDIYADPKGEFLAAKAASAVYRLFGSGGLPAENMPEPDSNISGDISFHYRKGRHDQTLYDWLHYLDLAGHYL